MKILKIILMLVLLFGVSVFGQDGITTEDGNYKDLGSTADTLEMDIPYQWETDTTYWRWIDEVDEEPDTLLEWFKDLTLSQKVAIYFLVEGDKDVDYKENVIEIPWTIELYPDADSPDMSKDVTGDDLSKYAN